MSGEFNNLEIRTGTLSIDRGDGGDPIDPGNVRLVNYGPLDDKYPISDPATNAWQGVIEFTKGLFAEFTFDDHSWELFQKWLGITAATTGPATPALPTTIPITVYKDDSILIKDTLGEAYTGPYAGVTFSKTIGGAALTEGADYQFGDTDGSFLVAEADPSGLDGLPLYIKAGTYTTVATRQFNFTNTEGNTKAKYTYTKNLRNGKVFTLYIPSGYVVASPSIQHKPDGTTEYMIRIESVWDAASVGYELGYIKFTT